MHDLLTSLNHPVYIFGAVIGIIIGIYYGFDGWRGDTAELPFQETPRVKNLIFILGGGFTAAIGDIKALDEHADRLLLILAYIIACLLAGSAIVLFWGLIVAFQRGYASWQKKDYDYKFWDAVGDYFFYGYRYYRRRADLAKDNQSVRFHLNYLDQLTRTITAAGGIKPAATMEVRLQVVRSILSFVAAVISVYHRVSEDDNHGIRANVMLHKACDDQLRARLLFAGTDRNQIANCLVLIAYDVDDNEPGIVLPVPNPEPGAIETALPGAPTAFLHPDGHVEVDDTSQITFAAHIPDPIRSEVNTYFAQRIFKSFGCIRIIGGGRTIGVLNVEARLTNVFGNTEIEKRKIVRYLLPFCAALGIVLADT